jgi:surfeit locus 1 family protein
MTVFSSRLFAATIAVIFLGCLGLGTWQVQRLRWKEDLLARIAVQMAKPAAPLPASPADWRALDFRRFEINGRFRHDQEQLLGPRSHRGNPGYHVITPFALADGRLLLVNRGWVPLAARAPERRPRGQLAGPQTLSGVLRADFKRGQWTPDYDAKARLWFWYDVAGMANLTGLELLPVVLRQDAGAAPGGLPIGGGIKITIANNHLQYALVWYALAAVTAVMFAIHRRRPDKAA